MRKAHSFTPAVSDTLETRCVPTVAFAPHASLFTVGAISNPVPVHYPPGIFTYGPSVPTVHTAANGEKFILSGAITAPKTTTTVKAAVAPTTVKAAVAPTTVKAAVAPTTVKAAVVPVTPVHYPPGIFTYGPSVPTVHTATDGEKYTL